MTSASPAAIRAWAADQGIECPRHGSVPRHIVDQYNAVHRASTGGTWTERAACRGADDPELWFPIGTAGPALLQAEEARQVCRRCPVREQCLDHAIDTGSDGIWGGTDENERKSIRRRASRKRVSV